MESKKSINEMGGRSILEKISKAFYDKVYEDKWIGRYFEHIDQDHIERQQVDFMLGALGGDKIYLGRPPKYAHQNMFINEELFNLRETLLLATFEELEISDELKERWLKIDEAFKSAIVKGQRSEATKTFHDDIILDFEKPLFYKKSA